MGFVDVEDMSITIPLSARIAGDVIHERPGSALPPVWFFVFWGKAAGDPQHFGLIAPPKVGNSRRGPFRIDTGPEASPLFAMLRTL